MFVWASIQVTDSVKQYTFLVSSPAEEMGCTFIKLRVASEDSFFQSLLVLTAKDETQSEQDPGKVTILHF